MLDGPDYRWRVIRDLAADESTLEVSRDEGRFRLEEIDLEVEDRRYEWYSTYDDDFESARGETRFVRSFKRGAWHARTETRTVLTCTAEAFQLHAALDAYEGDKRVFCRSWDRTIPRDCL